MKTHRVSEFSFYSSVPTSELTMHETSDLFDRASRNGPPLKKSEWNSRAGDISLKSTEVGQFFETRNNHDIRKWRWIKILWWSQVGDWTGYVAEVSAGC